MNPTELRKEQKRMNVAMRCGDFDLAQRIAVKIAPHLDALCDAADRNDRNPAPIAIWGTDA